MASSSLTRSLFVKPQTLAFLLSRSFSTTSAADASRFPMRSLSLLRRLRPLAFAAGLQRLASHSSAVRGFATRTTSSSLNDPSPNWSNRPPKETILLDGCDFEHWLVVMEKPEGEPTRDEIIDGYVKTLAMIIGSEQDARMKIYSVSTRCYYAFGCLVSEELSYKIKELPKVRWVLPDSYLDVKNKDYGGEPFINGEAVPYDPKYHEEWIRNNARANERNRRNDRPRNFDRSRNFERRRDNMQNRGASPMPNQGMQNTAPNMGGMPPTSNMGGTPPNPHMGGMPPNTNMGGMPPNSNMGGTPPNPHMGGMPPNPHMGGMPPNSNMGGMPPNSNFGGMPPNRMPPNSNMGGMPPNSNFGGMPPNRMPPNSNMGGVPPNSNMGGVPPNTNMGGVPLNNNMGGNMGGMPPDRNFGGMPPNNLGGMPQNNMGGMSQSNMGGMPQTGGWSTNTPNRDVENVQNFQNRDGY